MKTIIAVNLTVDDMAWVSRKLIAHYVLIKKSDVLDEGEKNAQIFHLVKRADRFGLTDLISYFGYNVLVIPLKNKREFKMIYPRNANEADFKIIQQFVESGAI